MDCAEEAINIYSQNLKKPGGMILDSDPNAPEGATITTPNFVFGAKSQICLTASCALASHYRTIGSSLSFSNIRWNPVIENFKDQWSALKSLRKDEEVKGPKISKALPMMKWS